MESRRGSWLLIAAAAVAAITVAIASRPTVSAQSPTDRWVGTWSTAEVGRPQTPPPPTPPLPPFMANQCPAPALQRRPAAGGPGLCAFAVHPFHESNAPSGRSYQHRRVESARRAQQRLQRCADDHWRRLDRVARQEGNHPSRVEPCVDLQRPCHDNDPGQRGRLQRSGGTRGCTDGRSRHRSLSPRHDEYPGSADDAHRGVADDLYLRDGESCRGCDAADCRHDSELVPVDRRPGCIARRDGRGRRIRRLDYGRNHVRRPRRTTGGPITWRDACSLSHQRSKMGVLNAGIAGNRVLGRRGVQCGINALARFELNALSQPGVTHIIVLEGINDIGNARLNPTPTAEDIIAGHRQLIERAHAQRTENLWRHIDALLGSGLLHGRWRGKASSRERVDSDQQRVRCRDRLRQGDARSKRTEEVPRRPTIPAITCTPVTPVTRPWPTRLTSDCSDRLTRRNQRRPLRDGEGRARLWLSRRTPVAGF